MPIVLIIAKLIAYYRNLKKLIDVYSATAHKQINKQWTPNMWGNTLTHTHSAQQSCRKSHISIENNEVYYLHRHSIDMRERETTGLRIVYTDAREFVRV